MHLISPNVNLNKNQIWKTTKGKDPFFSCLSEGEYRSGRINHMNFTILPQPGCCLHKNGPPTQTKSWTTPWKPWEERMGNDEKGKGKEKERNYRRW